MCVETVTITKINCVVNAIKETNRLTALVLTVISKLALWTSDLSPNHTLFSLVLTSTWPHLRYDVGR